MEQTHVAVKEKNFSTALMVPDERAVKQELQLAEPDALSPVQADPQLDQLAEKTVAMLISDEYEYQEKRSAVDQMGLKTQQLAARQMGMLQQPINTLTRDGDNGGPVAKSLVDLKVEIESLDPAKFDFSPGWFSRMLGWMPLVGTPLNKYFSQYESAQTVINAIIKSLEKGKDQLKRDTVTLGGDQKGMHDTMTRLERSIQLGQLIDQKLQYKLDREIPPEDPRHGFIAEELLYPLRQRIMDLQQQLAVNQQGILATEIIIRNNRELIRGVDRALNVTINALQVAVTVALGLANQKIVLTKIEAVNKTTSDLISHTAQQLRTQGVAIHKQASQSMLNMEALEKAFADINGALEDIAKFRQEALPQMANSILRMNTLTEQTAKTIGKLEEGNRAKAAFMIDVE